MSARPLKIVHVITSLNDGGAEGMLYRISVADRINTHLVVSLIDEGKYGSMLRAAGVEVICLGMTPGKITLRSLAKLFLFLRSSKADVVQTWLYHADLIGGTIGRLAGVPKIVWGIRHSNLTPGTVKRSTIRIAKICAVLSEWVPTAIVCCSRQAMSAHVRIGYSKRKFKIIPNGYDLNSLLPDHAARQSLRRELNVDDDVPLIGMVARFDVQKDHPNLIAALRRVKSAGVDFFCLLVGTGMDPHNPDLGMYLDSNNVRDRVMLLGRRSDIGSIMNAIDIHVLSSLGEAFPNVLAEAMACGTPCITTDVGDAAYIVGDAGWVVPPGDSKALADAICEALKMRRDDVYWKNISDVARERIQENFTLDRVVCMYREVWS